jgi:hypothetical protein
MNSSDTPNYRVHVLGPGRRFLDIHALDCATDEEALTRFQEYTDRGEVELWDKTRKIAVIPLGGPLYWVF